MCTDGGRERFAKSELKNPTKSGPQNCTKDMSKLHPESDKKYQHVYIFKKMSDEVQNHLQQIG